MSWIPRWLNHQGLLQSYGVPLDVDRWARGDALIQAPPELEELVKSTWQAWRSWGVDLEEKGPKRGEESVKSAQWTHFPVLCWDVLRMRLFSPQMLHTSGGLEWHGMACGWAHHMTNTATPLCWIKLSAQAATVSCVKWRELALHIMKAKGPKPTCQGWCLTGLVAA